MEGMITTVRGGASNVGLEAALAKINLGRVLIVYLFSIAPIGLITFLILVTPIILPMMTGQATDDFSSPGAGMLIISYALEAGQAGLLGALPFALFVDYLLRRRTERKQHIIRQNSILL
jgi:hypothetical protein